MVTDILSYLTNCPFLSDFNMNVDFLGKNQYSLSVSGRGTSTVLKKYTDGDSLVKSIYRAKFRLPYGIDKDRNCETAELLENIENWVKDRSSLGILPELSEDKIPISVELTFLRDKVSHSSDTAVYTADIALIFYKAKQKGSKIC